MWAVSGVLPEQTATAYLGYSLHPQVTSASLRQVFSQVLGALGPVHAVTYSEWDWVFSLLGLRSTAKAAAARAGLSPPCARACPLLLSEL